MAPNHCVDWGLRVWNGDGRVGIVEWGWLEWGEWSGDSRVVYCSVHSLVSTDLAPDGGQDVHEQGFVSLQIGLQLP